MTLEILTDVKLKTSAGILTLNAGQLAEMPDHLARKIIQQGKGRAILTPDECQGCSFELSGKCYAKINGRLCSVSYKECSFLKH